MLRYVIFVLSYEEKDKLPIRILVADDHAIFRGGLRKLLEAANDISIVGEASKGA